MQSDLMEAMALASGEIAGLFRTVATPEWAQFFLALAVAALTAFWALRKWFAERAQRRLEEKNRISALYVNPFLIACENLQSRLYNILELKGLTPLQQHYPDGSYADEVLYLIALYFGWLQCMYRYSPYANDQHFLRLAATIERDFATDKAESGGLGPLCFFRPEQHSLGQLAMNRTSGEFGSEFVGVSFFEFRRRLRDHGYPQSKAVSDTLRGLRQAQYEGARSKENSTTYVLVPEALRQRSERIQTHLVELLEYLETRGNVTFFVSPNGGAKRKTAIPRNERKPWFARCRLLVIGKQHDAQSTTGPQPEPPCRMRR